MYYIALISLELPFALQGPDTSVADPNNFLAGSESDRLNSPNPDPHSCFTFPLYWAKSIADSVLKFKVSGVIDTAEICMTPLSQSCFLSWHLVAF